MQLCNFVSEITAQSSINHLIPYFILRWWQTKRNVYFYKLDAVIGKVFILLATYWRSLCTFRAELTAGEQFSRSVYSGNPYIDKWFIRMSRVIVKSQHSPKFADLSIEFLNTSVIPNCKCQFFNKYTKLPKTSNGIINISDRFEVTNT